MSAEEGSGYGPTEAAMIVRITRSAGNAACDQSWNDANSIHPLGDMLARIREVTR